MKEFRMSKGVTEHYTSLEELRTNYGLKPIKKKTNDEEKLKAQQNKFVGKCRVCGQNLSWIEGTNTLACQNPACKGIKMTSKNEEDDSEKTWFIPVTRILNDQGMEIAMNLFN